jgi:hypothetical protein
MKPLERMTAFTGESPAAGASPAGSARLSLTGSHRSTSSRSLLFGGGWGQDERAALWRAERGVAVQGLCGTAPRAARPARGPAPSG